MPPTGGPGVSVREKERDKGKGAGRLPIWPVRLRATRRLGPGRWASSWRAGAAHMEKGEAGPRRGGEGKELGLLGPE